MYLDDSTSIQFQANLLPIIGLISDTNITRRVVYMELNASSLIRCLLSGMHQMEAKEKLTTLIQRVVNNGIVVS